MKMLTALAGALVMAIATPAAAMDTPPDEPTSSSGGSGGGGSTPVPAPPVALIFGLAAGAILIRRKIA